MTHKTLFLTTRSHHHQKNALAGAPPELEVTILRNPTRAELCAHLHDTEFLITERAGEIDAGLIEAAPRLRLIQRLGSLTYDIDVAAAQRRGIPVCYWPIRGSILVAEHLIMQMLALVKKLPEVKAVAEAAAAWGQPPRRTDEDTYAYNWSGRTDIGSILGATVGILGFGEIGVELARRLRPFQPAQLLYYKRRRLPQPVEQELGLTYAVREALIGASDFLCSLLPYSAETDHLLDATAFARMKPGAFLVHCGSGSVIDEAALATAVRQGHLGGAALDTFEWEPIQPDSPLIALARAPHTNVLLTPHTAAGARATAGAPSRRSDYQNIQRLLEGEPLLYRI
jgi:phosphoglycerate dehydrogenase-like enzyme